jgi:hypothetical protein
MTKPRMVNSTIRMSKNIAIERKEGRGTGRILVLLGEIASLDIVVAMALLY